MQSKSTHTIKNVKYLGAPGWLMSDFSSGHDLMVGKFEPRIGLCADSSEPGTCFRFCVSLSLSGPPPSLSGPQAWSLSLSLSLSINKNIKIFFKKILISLV